MGKRVNSPVRKNLKRFMYVVLFFVVIFFLINLRVETKHWNKIMTVDEIPAQSGTAVVFGAGLRSRGVPGLILEDRVMKAIELYQNGKVNRILLSGDNESAAHNEVRAMKNLALQEGLSEEVLLFDHSGLSTYQTCARAYSEFYLNKVVLVTQKYHLKRAMYVCDEVGLDVLGVDATISNYSVLKFRFREVLAVVSDWVKVVF